MTRPLFESAIPQALRQDLLDVMKRHHQTTEPSVLLAAFAHVTGSLYQLTPPSAGTEEELMELIMENLSLGQQAAIGFQRAAKGKRH